MENKLKLDSVCASCNNWIKPSKSLLKFLCKEENEYRDMRFRFCIEKRHMTCDYETCNECTASEILC